MSTDKFDYRRGGSDLEWTLADGTTTCHPDLKTVIGASKSRFQIHAPPPSLSFKFQGPDIACRR